jgi:hypothetical protein
MSSAYAIQMLKFGELVAERWTSCLKRAVSSQWAIINIILKVGAKYAMRTDSESYSILCYFTYHFSAGLMERNVIFFRIKAILKRSIQLD